MSRKGKKYRGNRLPAKFRMPATTRAAAARMLTAGLAGDPTAPLKVSAFGGTQVHLHGDVPTCACCGEAADIVVLRLARPAAGPTPDLGQPPAGPVSPVWSRTEEAWLAMRPGANHQDLPLVPGPDDVTVQAVCRHLLGVAGRKAVVQFRRPVVPGLPEEGDLVWPDLVGVLQVPGQIGYCHANCAALWRARQADRRIQTGFGLIGGVWRQHTWLRDGEGRVLESTERPDLYFGRVLNPQEAAEFADREL